jgi:NitT/TauT family transport system ATP-binding protein
VKEDAVITLPDYHQQSPEVRARFKALAARPELLRLEGLTKRFKTGKGEQTVLDGIDFSVRQREFVTIIGASGCGKSTLLRLVSGLDEPSGGSIVMGGEPVTGPGPDRGMVFQSYSLFPWHTVLRNVAFGLKQNGKGAAIAEAEARTWIDLVGLAGYEDHYPAQLSGGMRQRVAIARALAAGPKVLLMDEPFGALDAQTRCRMQSYLLEIWKNVDVTILFVTHDLDEAIFLSDRILVLLPRPGRVGELIENPVPRPRTQSQLLSPEFLSVKRRLEELIHPEEDEDKFHMLKLTPAGDDV